MYLWFFNSYGLHEVNGRRYISDKLPGSVIVSTTADGLWGKRWVVYY